MTTWIEISAIVFTLLSVIFTAKNSIIAWPIGIAGCISYLIVFTDQKLFADAFLQIIFVLQSIYAWYNWNRPQKDIPITWLSRNDRDKTISITMLIYMITVIILSKTGGRLPLIDGLTTSISLVATYLLAKKKIDSWIYWIVTDTILIILFWVSGLYLSSLLYFILLIIASFGLYKWIKLKNIKAD